MFFFYSQNNSGGSFDYDDELGITENVFIEADSVGDANNKMESLIGNWEGGQGGYCQCCGSRWDPCDKSDGTENPEMYGQNITEDPVKSFFGESPHACAIHYKDGRVVML